MPKVREGTIALDQVKFKESSYPREHYKPALAKEYADAMINGAEFPPIRLEEESNVLLDGKHRVEAYKLYSQMHQTHATLQNGQGDLWPDPSLMIRCEWHTVPEGKTPKLYALSFQQKHGLRATTSESKSVCREQYEANPIPLEEMSSYTGQPRRTLQDWLQDLMNKVAEQRNAIVKRLDLLGWTQEEISGVLKHKWPEDKGSTQVRVSQILKEMADSPFLLKSDIDRLGIPETIKRYSIPEILAWALKLDGLSDEERLDEKGLNFKLQPYDVWHFSDSDDRFGADYPGRIPGQLVAHVLYFFTKPGEMIIDPMAGSGTTVDVCLAMGRQCYAYDINPFEDRVDIITHNLKSGWPERTKKADLIFWDPPYFRKKDEGYGDESVSRFTRIEYLSFFVDRLKEAKSLVKKGTRLAFLMSDWNSPYHNGDDQEAEDADTEKGGPIFLWDYTKLMQEAKWTLQYHIQVPLPTQQVHPDIVKKFRERRQLARLERYLLIAEA